MSDTPKIWKMTPEQQKHAEEYQKALAKLSPEERRRRSRSSMSDPVAIGMGHTTAALQENASAEALREAIEKDNHTQVLNAAEQLRQILAVLLQQNNPIAYHNLAALWVPKRKDFQRVFSEGADEAFQAYQDRFKVLPVPLPKIGQTHAIVEAAFPKDFEKTTLFPGGLLRIQDRIRPDTIWICWKFVRPNQRIGMAYNGLVAFDGVLKWFPKPWHFWKE